MKEIVDILSSVETHHNRALLVCQKLLKHSMEAAYTFAQLEKLEPRYRETRIGLLDGVTDITECVGQLTQDLLDLNENHLQALAEFRKEIK